MKKNISSIAAAAVLVASTAIAPAFAQQSNTTAPAVTKAPAATAAPAAAMTEGQAAYLTEQAANQVSANAYIGKSIYNGKDEAIGDVNDLIFEDNGGLVAAVVGVGGFLGIGEKDVALPINKITVTRDAKDDNELRLTTTETAEALKAAPAFKTLDDKQDEADKTSTSSTTPTPATGNGATSPSTAPSK